MTSRLPYFDLLFDAKARGVAGSEAFERFVHLGYWPEPSTATLGIEDFVAAAERLNALLLETALIRNGQSLLDVGCGVGGTLEAISIAPCSSLV